MDRSGMIARMKERGWSSKLAFGQSGPILFIHGDFLGYIEMPVPADIAADHTQALMNVYALYGSAQESMGIMGQA